MLISFTVRKHPDKFVVQMNSAVSAPDRELLESHPELVDRITDEWQEAFRSGIGGIHQESALCTRPWGFQLEDIAADVHLWHGEMDNNVVSSVGHYVAEAIPNCQATFYADEGHFSVFHNHIEEILGALTA